jgi:hypothetical protein
VTALGGADEISPQKARREYNVPLRVTHGFLSATVVHDVEVLAGRMKRPFVVLYLGDHDGAGMYMSEMDLAKRLPGVRIERIALTEADTRELGEELSFPVKPDNRGECQRRA